MQKRNSNAESHGFDEIILDKSGEFQHHRAKRKSMELERTAAAKIMELHRVFPCVMVTGARQVGKSTLLRSILPEGMRYVSLDHELMLMRAQEDPIGFLEEMGSPLCIDEVQYEPRLLRAIKLKVDITGAPGQYWLTGSQRFHLMQGVAESLAGRIGLVELYSLSQSEIVGKGKSAEPFDPEDFQNRLTPPACDINTLYERIWKGGYPRMYKYEDTTAEDFFSAYLNTYIARDVRALTQVGDTSAFMRFMQSIASRTGQQLIYADVAKDADVSPNTIKKWISVLETSGVIDLLQPYYTNTSKRLAKSPKIYFNDTGFCAWLGGWHNARVLQRGAMAGAMLETWVYGQLRRSYTNRGIRAKLSYYRNSNGAEVDFLLEKNGKIYPMEVKRSSSPKPGDLSGVATIPTAPGVQIQPGIVLYTAMETLPLGKGRYAYPISMI